MQNLAKGMTLTAAARKAGYSEKYPAQAGNQALEQAKRKVPELMEMYGLGPAILIEKYLTPALEAEETKFAQKDGIFTDERNVIAWGPRLTALDMALDLGGCFPENKSGNGVAVNIQIVTNTEFADPYA